ncbi:unnamed protein product, partial [Ectocarpus sp. 12 AP-2014]
GSPAAPDFDLRPTHTYDRESNGYNSSCTKRLRVHFDQRAGVMHPLFTACVGERWEGGMFGNTFPFLLRCHSAHPLLHTQGLQSSNALPLSPRHRHPFVPPCPMPACVHQLAAEA